LARSSAGASAEAGAAAPLPAKSEVRRPGDRNGQLEHDRYCAANSYTIGPSPLGGRPGWLGDRGTLNGSASTINANAHLMHIFGFLCATRLLFSYRRDVRAEQSSRLCLRLWIRIWIWFCLCFCFGSPK